ncbi:NAD(P)H-hydrate dehydratase [Phaeovulum sp.]|uniref:NAD(P)H-hydrate dehydratase n=1 Tax=Phaeovulum sp. TaxID=2934796 RepID=UPI0039E47761
MTHFLLTSGQMRAVEQAAINMGSVTGRDLMERAGQGVVSAIFAAWPQLQATSHRAVVLCGPGNNGGDGFVIARLLTEWGWTVEVFLSGDPAKLPPDARSNYTRWCAMGGVRPLERAAVSQLIPAAVFHDPQQMPPVARAQVVVDALFGTGLTRKVEGLDGLFDLSAQCRDLEFPKWISVDVPSGLCADSGRGLDRQVEKPHAILRADLTVTFQWPKVGHFLAYGPYFCGRVAVADIGLTACDGDPPSIPPVGDWPKRPVTLSGFANASGILAKRIEGHKYSHGHALVLSGGVGRGGAARLAARGALRIGAGLVTVACPPEALTENAARLDAVMLRTLADTAAFDEMIADTRLNALLLGPGLGVARARAMVPAALAAKRACVLDADALTAYAGAPDKLFAALHKNCVLTPHKGEFTRLFPDIATRLDAPATKGPAYSKVDATRDAAARAGCVVLLKGVDTVIATPEGECGINSAHYARTAPWLATAGAGDVLAGFVTGLLARGIAPFQAASTAAWLHVEAARHIGPGLIAEDLPDALPAVLRTLHA